MNENIQRSAHAEHGLVEDEIDLGRFFQLLWGGRAAIFSVTVLCMVIAITYLFFFTPIYKVESVLRPVALSELDALNRTGIYDLTPEQALQRVGGLLGSYDFRLNFYRTNQTLFNPVKEGRFSLEQTFQAFNKEAFKMLRPDPKKEQGLTPYLGIELTYPRGVDGVAIVNGLVAASVRAERETISSNLKGLIKNRLNQLELESISEGAKYEAKKQVQIATLLEADKLQRATLQDELKALREKIKTQRENRIETLAEAIEIANALGIERPTIPLALSENGKVAQGNIFKTEINNQYIPLYFLGSEALEAERQTLLKRRSDNFAEPRIAEIEKELQMLKHNRAVEILKQRENESLFFGGQAAARKEITRLRNIQTDISNINLVAIDWQALEPMTPIKPRKSLVLVLSVLLGLFLGSIVALTRNYIQKS